LKAFTNSYSIQIGDTTHVIPSSNSRTGMPTFCDTLGLTEWMPVISGGLIEFVSGPPEINLSRTTFIETAFRGQSLCRDLRIANLGQADLFYEVNGDSSWISLNNTGGNIRHSGVDTIGVIFNIDDLFPDTYEAHLHLVSNDPTENAIDMPITLNIVNESGNCSYFVGDINGSQSTNGLDVVYGISYLKGGPNPHYPCNCPTHGIIYAAGDVNASCQFNGVDITYMVAYFKGGPALQYCPDCPPSEHLAPPGPRKESTLLLNH
jgi:hypothetical protein